MQIPITTYATSDIRQSRSALQAAMKQQLEDQLEQYGMRVDSVDIRNISFTDEVQKNLDNVQAQKAQTNQAIEKLNTARLAAEAVRVDAQAQSDRDQITRCGATTITVPKTVNGKTVEETQVVPVPNDKCQNRLNENVLASKYIDMLEKAAEKGNTIYVVPQGASNIISLAGPSSAGRN